LPVLQSRGFDEAEKTVRASCTDFPSLFSSSSWAGTFTVFNKTYYRTTGEPVTEIDTFSVLSPNTTYTIEIYNGGMEDDPDLNELVSSSVISLNGTETVSPNEFNQNVNFIQKPITLSTVNELSVQLRGKPGGAITINIVGIDDDPPSITASLSAEPNAAGWHRQDVTVSFECSDAISGLETCSGPVTVSTEGAGQVITGTATDKAGNSSTASVTVNLDKTPPEIVASPDPPPNANGWNNTDVTVSFTCTDTGSGIASCSAPVLVGTEGAARTVAGTVTDLAGNSAEASATINLDKTPPVVESSQNPPANAAGWNNSDVTVTFTGSDMLSGIDSVTPPVTVSTEGQGQAVVGEAFDLAGNGKALSVQVNLDKTPPAVTASADPPPNTAGWNNSDVTVTFAGTDGLSGIAEVAPPITIVTEGEGQAFNGTATDFAGNAASTSITINLDKTPPVVTISSPVNDSETDQDQVTVSGTATDNSGVSAADLNGTPLILTNDSFSSPAALTEGANSLTVSATDLAGNLSSSTVSVTRQPTNLQVQIFVSSYVYQTDYASIAILVDDGSDGTVNVTANGVTATPFSRDGVYFNYFATVPLLVGENTVTVDAEDSQGRVGTVSVVLTRTIPDLILSVTSPSDGLETTETPIPVSGGVSPASAEVSINGVPVTVSTTGSFSGSVDLVEGINTITIHAMDAYGQEKTETRQVTYTIPPPPPPPDTTPPALSLISPAGGAISTQQTVDIVVGANEPLSQASMTILGQTVPNDGTEATLGPVSITDDTVTATLTVNDAVADLTVGIFVKDLAGNSTITTIAFYFDFNNPEVTIDSPADGYVTNQTHITVSGFVVDPGHPYGIIPDVYVNGVKADILGNIYTAAVDLVKGPNIIRAVSTDSAGNEGSAQITVTVDLFPPVVGISSPSNGSTVASQTATVTGTVDDPDASVSVNGIPASVGGGSFTASGVPIHEGPNYLTAVGTDPLGNVGTATIQVNRDTVSPTVAITSPPDGYETNSSVVTVTGTVNDLAAGGVSVSVNGVPAQITNGTFLVTDLPLSAGPNSISAVATDSAGNTGVSNTVTVNFTEAVDKPRLQMVSGNNQTTQIGEQLPAPLVVELVDETGAPVPNGTVVFKVLDGDGILENGGPEFGRSMVVTSDDQGRAQIIWRMGSRVGAGNNRVQASSVGYFGKALFSASVTPEVPARILADFGARQTGIAGRTPPDPFIAVVTDGAGNRLSGVRVTFSAVEGGGLFNGEPATTVITDNDGRAIATMALGPGDGIDNNIAEATFDGNPGLPARFIVSGKLPGDPADTKISGVVLDQTNQPVPGVTLSVAGTALAVQSDAQGQFTITSAPVGSVHLIADGKTAQRPGTWSKLEFDLVTIAGQNNTVGRPIYLLPIDAAHGLFVSGITGGTLTLPKLPGFSLSLQPGAATFTDGSQSGVVSATMVNTDKLPMTPGFGQKPALALSIQPDGAVFDPPAAVSIPNARGLSPGQVTDLYMYDPDLRKFSSVGTGTVSADGTSIASNSGIKKGGYLFAGADIVIADLLRTNATTSTTSTTQQKTLMALSFFPGVSIIPANAVQMYVTLLKVGLKAEVQSAKLSVVQVIGQNSEVPIQDHRVVIPSGGQVKLKAVGVPRNETTYDWKTVLEDGTTPDPSAAIVILGDNRTQEVFVGSNSGGRTFIRVDVACQHCEGTPGLLTEIVEVGAPGKVEFDTTKVHERNLNQGEFNKSVALIWAASQLVDLETYLTPDSDAANVRWTVNGAVRTSGTLDYGSEPGEDNISKFEIKAVHEFCSNSTNPFCSDQMILVVVPQVTLDNMNNWINSQNTAWLSGLPEPYSSLKNGTEDPEPGNCDPQRWKDSVGSISTNFHPNAAYEMRSEVLSEGHGHQATYTPSGELIREGMGAGTADFVSPGILTFPGHVSEDVEPFVWAAQLDGNPVESIVEVLSLRIDLTEPLMHRGDKLDDYLIYRPTFNPSNKSELGEGNCSLN
jgi:hypothetical protein